MFLSAEETASSFPIAHHRSANQLGTYPAIFSCWAEATHSYWKILGYKTK
jgi:hypothetical protein